MILKDVRFLCVFCVVQSAFMKSYLQSKTASSSVSEAVGMSRPAVTSDSGNNAVFHINEAMKADNNYADLSDQLGVFRYS